MSTDLRVFLIYPSDLIVYNLSNPNTGRRELFNAGTLKLIKDVEIRDFKQIEGMVTSAIGVNPTVLAYSNGMLEIVYAPNNGKSVLKYDKTLAKHPNATVTAKSTLQVPDLRKNRDGDVLPKLDLNSPDENLLSEYISNSTRRSKTDDIFKSISRDNSLTFNNSPNEVEQLRAEVDNLKNTLDYLKNALVALNRRLYQLSPVNLPNKLIYDGKLRDVVPFDFIQSKINNDEVDTFVLVPELQPFAGSHRNNNRMLTFKLKNGDIYHVRAEYDPKSNKITESK